MTQARAAFGQKAGRSHPVPTPKPRSTKTRSAAASGRLFYGVVAAFAGLLLLGGGYAAFSSASASGYGATVASKVPAEQSKPALTAMVKPSVEPASQRKKQPSPDAIASAARARTLGCVRRMPATKSEEQACSTALSNWVKTSGAKRVVNDIMNQMPELRDSPLRDQFKPVLERALQQAVRGGAMNDLGGAIQPYIRR